MVTTADMSDTAITNIIMGYIIYYSTKTFFTKSIRAGSLYNMRHSIAVVGKKKWLSYPLLGNIEFTKLGIIQRSTAGTFRLVFKNQRMGFMLDPLAK